MRKGGNNGVSLSGVVTAAALSLFIAVEGLAAGDIARQPAALDYAGIYKLRDMQPSLTGAGVKIAAVGRSMTYIDGLPMNDHRPNASHDCFAGGTLAFRDRSDIPAGVSVHETAIASILFGRQTNASLDGLGTFRYEGAVPEASAEFYEFWHFLTNNVFPGQRPDVDVVTISLGSQFEDWWTRGIDAMAERYGVPVVAGIGNGLSAYDSALFPAAGSNIIAVGVIEEVRSSDLETSLSRFWLPQANSSSYGPTDDNRAKPDVVAPGKCVAADGTSPSAFLVTPSCSSYATPVVTGTIGLLAQAAKADPNLSDAIGEGSGMLMRAILLTSARKLPYWHKGETGSHDDHLVPLDYSQGAGAVDAVGAYRLLEAGRQKDGQAVGMGWDIGSLAIDESGTVVYPLDTGDVTNGTITATLVWNRHYSQAYPFAHDTAHDVDLALELWAFDSSGARLVDYSDSHADNVEHISFVAEPGVQYIIQVRTSEGSVKNTARERYAVAWQVARSPARDATWYDLNGDGVVNTADVASLISRLRSVAR